MSTNPAADLLAELESEPMAPADVCDQLRDLAEKWHTLEVAAEIRATKRARKDIRDKLRRAGVPADIIAAATAEVTH